MRKNWKKCPRYDAILFGRKITGLTAERLEDLRAEEIEKKLSVYKQEKLHRRRIEDALQGYL